MTPIPESRLDEPIEFIERVSRDESEDCYWTVDQHAQFDAVLSALRDYKRLRAEVEMQRVQLGGALLTLEVVRQMASGEHEVPDLMDDTDGMNHIAKYIASYLAAIKVIP